MCNVTRKIYFQTRIFSYLTVNDGEEFPGKLACENDGFMKKLVDSEDIISQMQDYFSFLASNTISISNTTWTAPYVDALGLGLMVTVAIPVQSKITNKWVLLTRIVEMMKSIVDNNLHIIVSNNLYIIVLLLLIIFSSTSGIISHH